MTQVFQMKIGKVLRNKRNKNEFRNDKTVTAIVGQLSDKDERVVVNISLDQLQKI